MKASCTIKLFIGYELNHELKSYLSNSLHWKSESVSSESPLQEISYQNKLYIGLYLNSSVPSVIELKAMQAKIYQTLESYCPELNVPTLNLIVFPQVFLP